MNGPVSPIAFLKGVQAALALSYRPIDSIDVARNAIFRGVQATGFRGSTGTRPVAREF